MKWRGAQRQGRGDRVGTAGDSEDARLSGASAWLAAAKQNLAARHMGRDPGPVAEKALRSRRRGQPLGWVSASSLLSRSGRRSHRIFAPRLSRSVPGQGRIRRQSVILWHPGFLPFTSGFSHRPTFYRLPPVLDVRKHGPVSPRNCSSRPSGPPANGRAADD